MILNKLYVNYKGNFYEFVAVDGKFQSFVLKVRTGENFNEDLKLGFVYDTLYNDLILEVDKSEILGVYSKSSSVYEWMKISGFLGKKNKTL